MKRSAPHEKAGRPARTSKRTTKQGASATPASPAPSPAPAPAPSPPGAEEQARDATPAPIFVRADAELKRAIEAVAARWSEQHGKKYSGADVVRLILRRALLPQPGQATKQADGTKP